MEWVTFNMETKDRKTSNAQLSESFLSNKIILFLQKGKIINETILCEHCYILQYYMLTCHHCQPYNRYTKCFV